jgi:hypothetical protein
LPSVPRFFFNHRDGDRLFIDDEGVEFGTIEEARVEAEIALTQIVKEALREDYKRGIAIEVSDESHTPLLRVSLSFEVQALS